VFRTIFSGPLVVLPHDIVSEMPAGIEKTYERDLKRILDLGDERDRAVSILRWTLFALRPLTVRELTEALAADVNDDCGTYPRDDLQIHGRKRR
jgi:hypothetical protein